MISVNQNTRKEVRQIETVNDIITAIGNVGCICRYIHNGIEHNVMFNGYTVDDKGTVLGIHLGSMYVTPEQLYKEYTTIDGLPVGVTDIWVRQYEETKKIPEPPKNKKGFELPWEELMADKIMKEDLLRPYF